MAPRSTTDVDPRIERTRKVVLEAAVELITEIGYDNTTIEGVSERCGVARSTIYRHWAGRNDLLVDAVKHRLIGQPEIDTGSLRSDVLALLQDLVRWFGSTDGVMMVLHLLTVAHRDEQVKKLHREATRGRRNYLAHVIQRAIDRGEVPADLDPQEAANDLVGAFFYKKIVVHEEIDIEYAEARADRWLTQIGWNPVNVAN